VLKKHDINNFLFILFAITLLLAIYFLKQNLTKLDDFFLNNYFDSFDACLMDGTILNKV
jgi:hypothetical protein